jgi:hypothetical protein
MSKFISYQNIDFRLDDKFFYANQVSLSMQASLSPVLLSDGSLLNYAPDGALVGSLSCEFYLTGAIPDFLNLTGSHTSAITASFAGVSIPEVYAKSLSFNIEPFKPILMSAEFDWYGNVQVANFNPNSQTLKNNIEIPNYIANAYKSYLTYTNLGGGFGNTVSINYTASADRPSYYKVNSVFPFRVAKLNKKVEVSLSADSLGNNINYTGRAGSTVIYLKDTYGTLLDSFPVSGLITNQKYDVNNGQYLMSSANIMQQVDDIKTLV